MLGIIRTAEKITQAFEVVTLAFTVSLMTTGVILLAVCIAG